MKNDNVLWVHNPGTSDVSISDLGVKVPAGKAVNVYRINPYLTVAQVKKSQASGALAKRLNGKILYLVRKAVSVIPPTLGHKRESNKAVQARKTKTSVVIESNLDEADEEGSFDFADYGVTDLGPVEQKREAGSVFVEAKKDEPVADPRESVVQLEPELESGVSKQSQVVMKTTRELMVDPTGPIADATAQTVDRPFTVVKPPAPTVVEPVIEARGELTVSKDESGAIVVGNDKPRSLKAVKEAVEEGEESPDDMTLESTKFDTKVATTTDDGAVVMKLKQDEEPAPKK